MGSLASKRVVVTGGSGFLGRHVVAALATRGCTVLVPRKAQYDLTRVADVERMYTDLEPQVVLHLAAVVGGIGANRDSPGRFFFENVMLGAHHTCNGSFIADGLGLPVARRAERELRESADRTLARLDSKPAVVLQVQRQSGREDRCRRW